MEPAFSAQTGLRSWLIAPTSMVKQLAWHGSPVQREFDLWGWHQTVLCSLPAHCQVTCYLLFWLWASQCDCHSVPFVHCGQIYMSVRYVVIMTHSVQPIGSCVPALKRATTSLSLNSQSRKVWFVFPVGLILDWRWIGWFKLLLEYWNYIFLIHISFKEHNINHLISL